MFKGGILRFSPMAQDLFEGEKVLAFDLETTGVSTTNDRIVQFALIGTLADGTAVNHEQVVKPNIRIPYDATQIHGISNEDVRDKPPLSEVADQLADLIDGAILVGHNVRKFDFAMLKTEFLRMGRLAPQPKAIMDTLELVRRLRLPRPHNLGALCKRHGIRLEAAHTAAADAAATMLLFWRLSVEHASAFRRSLPELERWIAHGDRPKDATELGRGLEDLAPVDAMGKVREDGDELVLAFGRHRGRYLSEIQASDPSYIGWLLSAKGLDCEATKLRIKEHLQS
jgi:DNA polymerase-3 subunit epsilon